MYPDEITKTLKDLMFNHEWLAGTNPSDGQNPWGFKSDGTFKTLKDGHGGNWNIEMRGPTPVLTLKWSSNAKWADWEIEQFSIKQGVRFKAIKTSWSWMNSWKVQSKGPVRIVPQISKPNTSLPNPGLQMPQPVGNV
jgi:hypothetical protein